MNNISFKIISKIGFFAFILGVASCETYGPASRFQGVRMMERPFFDGSDTSATYVAAKVGLGVGYKPEDRNKIGELSLHRGWSFRNFYAAVGAFGQFGEYKLRDSAAFNYNAFGLRGEIGQISRFDNMEVEFLNVSVARSYESGSFAEFRKKFEQGRNGSSGIPYRWTTEFQSHLGVKQRFSNNQVFGFRIGFGYSYNSQDAFFSFINTSFQFNKNIHANLNFVTAQLFSNENTVFNNALTAGLTFGF